MKPRANPIPARTITTTTAEAAPADAPRTVSLRPCSRKSSASATIRMKPGTMKASPPTIAPLIPATARAQKIASWVEAGPGRRLVAATASWNSRALSQCSRSTIISRSRAVWACGPPTPRMPSRPQRARTPRRSSCDRSGRSDSGAEVLDRLAHRGVERRHVRLEPLAGELLRERQGDVVEGDRPGGVGHLRLDRLDDLGDRHRRAGEVVGAGAVRLRTCRADEAARDVGRVVELGAAAEGDVVRLAVGSGLHRQRRSRGQPLVAAGPEDDERADADAGHALVGRVDGSRAFVRDLEDAVERSWLPVPALVVDGGGAGVRDRRLESVPAGGLEDVHRADDVDGRAERRIRLDERHLERGQVEDVRDLVLAERLLDLDEVGDVPADERDLVDLVRRRDQLEPVPVVAEVVPHDGGPFSDEQRRGPRPDAPEHPRDEEPAAAHALTLS